MNNFFFFTKRIINKISINRIFSNDAVAPITMDIGIKENNVKKKLLEKLFVKIIYDYVSNN